MELPFLVAALPPSGRPEILAVGRATAQPDGSRRLEGASPSFRARVEMTPSARHPGRWDLRLTVTCLSPVPLEAGLRVEVRLGPTADPGWLVPGLFYGENRLPACTRRYPRFTRDSPDPAALEADAWGFRADRAATPAVFAWDASGGAALVTAESSALGQAGVGFAMDGRHPLLRLHFPYREEPVRYDGSAHAQPADLPAYRWEPGRTVSLDAALYLLDADRHGYADVLRDVHDAPGRHDVHDAPGGRDVHGGPADPGGVAWVSIAEAADLTAWGLLRWHYRPDPAVLLETAAFDREALGARGDRPAMHVSWVSGTPYAFALLAHGRRRGAAQEVAAAAAVLDHIAANLAPAGTFWGQWTASAGWGTGWTPQPHRLHARTAGDATLFLLRSLAAERALGHEHPGWEGAVRSNLDAACAMQREDGAFPAGFDARNGAALSWDGSAGLAWVPALAEAAASLDEPAYLRAAARAGAYYARSVEAEFLCGAPEDVDLAPTSEDGYVAVMAYTLLFEQDGDPAWLALARRAADWTLTFRYTYDVAFPPRTLLGQYGFRTRGADQASPSNQHLHSFGLIALPEMVRLARHLGDPYYLETTRENLACFRQLVAREDGDINAYRGMVSERYYQTACFQAKGMLLTLSHAWSVGVLLLACEAALGIPELSDAGEQRAAPERAAHAAGATSAAPAPHRRRNSA